MRPTGAMLERREKIWKRVAQYRGMDKDALVESIANHLEFSLCKNRYTATDFDVYESLALSIRDRLIEFWNDTKEKCHNEDAKCVYYLSLEFLMGRSLRNNLINLGIYDVCREALSDIGYDLETLEEMEHDAGLGNGGLGRLAACFLDSLATLRLPAYGYGIRYEFGIFEQKIEEGQQVEGPDNWLLQGHPWEVPRFDQHYPVKFYGETREYRDGKGRRRHAWEGSETVLAMPYDVPTPGYGVHNVNTLRLWSAKACSAFDFHLFNRGDYVKAVEEKEKSETISKVLYPNDNDFAGKELRLKQQFFFVSASLQDIIHRYKRNHDNFEAFADKVAIQLNDTHPAIAIPELMRLLIDGEGLDWNQAWALCVRTFAYTNHTVMPEALEKWSVELLEYLLPRHMKLIYEINARFLEDARRRFPDDHDLIGRVSLIEESWPKNVRMAHLAIVGSHAVNGVAELHSDLIRATIFKDFVRIFPDKFHNVTNGITPRRWLRNSNPDLAALISSRVGDGWVTDLTQLEKLAPLADQGEFRRQFLEVKAANKRKLAAWVREQSGVSIDPEAIFDVQVKRIHEYKRQLLNVLHVIALYNRIKDNPDGEHTPRVVMIGGKAAPGYFVAKKIIRLINDAARVINDDPVVGDKLKLVFLENFGVSLGERVYPAADLSEQISTVGMEASGTGNMKFALNGALTIGTLDGANIEIQEEVGAENMFIFGMDINRVRELRAAGYDPRACYSANAELRRVVDMIGSGYFNPKRPDLYADLVSHLLENDHYLVMADFPAYMEAQAKAARLYRDRGQWARMAVMNVARVGKFSSDRAIGEYAERIWGAKPVEVQITSKKARHFRS